MSARPTRREPRRAAPSTTSEADHEPARRLMAHRRGRAIDDLAQRDEAQIADGDDVIDHSRAAVAIHTDGRCVWRLTSYSSFVDCHIIAFIGETSSASRRRCIATTPALRRARCDESGHHRSAAEPAGRGSTCPARRCSIRQELRAGHRRRESVTRATDASSPINVSKLWLAAGFSCRCRRRLGSRRGCLSLARGDGEDGERDAHDVCNVGHHRAVYVPQLSTGCRRGLSGSSAVAACAFPFWERAARRAVARRSPARRLLRAARRRAVRPPLHPPVRPPPRAPAAGSAAPEAGSAARPVAVARVASLRPEPIVGSVAMTRAITKATAAGRSPPRRAAMGPRMAARA